jgi:hypothetical protein
VRRNFGLGSPSHVIGQIGPGTALQIAEVVVVKGSTSADDLAHLEAYLKTRHGLQWPFPLRSAPYRDVGPAARARV